MNRIPGFTLVELIVTIAIAGILLALAIPSFRETTLNNQRAARVNLLMTDLQFARSQALELRRNVIICRTDQPQANNPICGNGNGWEEGWVVISKAAGNADTIFETGDVILRRQDRLITVAEIAKANTAKFTMRGNGSAALNTLTRVVFANSGLSNNNGTIAVCDLRNDITKGRSIIVATTGQVRSSETVTSCQR